MVSAAAVAGDVIKLCDEPDTSPELISVTMLLIALLRAMEGVVEQGLVPFSRCLPHCQCPRQRPRCFGSEANQSAPCRPQASRAGY
jgi:hypothetical protein